MEQRSPEWFAERLGRVTSTSAAAILNPKARAASTTTLIGELVREIATADYKNIPDTFWMRHGRETEPAAVAAYELYTGRKVSPGGFLVSSHDDLLGASPDGIIGFREGSLEVKCLSPDNHGAVLVQQGPVDSGHLWQMAWHMMIGETRWCDYVCYCPDYPEHLRLFIKRYRLSDVIGEVEAVSSAWHRVWGFLSTYRGHLDRLNLSL